MSENAPNFNFTPYQKFMVAILAIMQFTVVLDFMVLSPLGALLLEKLNINTQQFGLVVSAYAFSAGASGLLAAGFADKFDRKKLLLFFYTGFIIGTFLCGIAPNYEFLLMARIVTGLFGGVISSIGFAIITDLFVMQQRGRVMGFVQMSFAGSQVLGIPVGLYFANKLGWHSPFIIIVGLSILVALVILIKMKPINAHLETKSNTTAFQHLTKIFTNGGYIKAFGATVLLATGGFMLMPFASAFSVNNLGLKIDDLPMLYMFTGLFSMAVGPLAGKLSDKTSKISVFFGGSVLTMIVVSIYCNLGITPFWLVLLLNILLFAGVLSRVVPAQALMTAVPEPQDRGAFMSVNSSIQQISGGVASAVAGMIVVQTEGKAIENYNVLGYVVIVSMIITLIMMNNINSFIQRKQA
ncbi:MAG: MFS transporter [Bacteroidetes bacterium]|nr:MFS transporter [Bacteroidota bacterium]